MLLGVKRGGGDEAQPVLENLAVVVLLKQAVEIIHRLLLHIGLGEDRVSHLRQCRVARPNFGGGAEFQSTQFLDIDLDPRKTQKDFFRYRANIGIADPARGWSFRLYGENLSDARTSIRQGDVVPGLFVNIQEAPRQIYGQFRYDF